MVALTKVDIEGLITAFETKRAWHNALGNVERVAGIEECIQHLKDYKLAIHILDDDGWQYPHIGVEND